MNDLKDVFISYGREPEVVLFVKQLKKDLETNGLSVWVDTDDIQLGADWRAEITSGIDNCKVFMPIITQKYVSSRYCVNELYAADNDKKVIFPVIFSDADFTVSDTAKGVKFVVSSINWTMCRPAIDDYRQSLDKLISAIKGKDRVEGTKEPSSNIAGIPKSTSPIKTILGLNNPNGVAVSHDQKVLVTMMEACEVWVFDEHYEKVGTIGGAGVEEGKFYSPFGIAVDHDNHVIITCAALQCVQKFTLDGKYLKGAGKPGKGEFELHSANGVAVSKGGTVYVCDLGNNRIQMLNTDLQFLGNFSLADPEYGSGSLNHPSGIAINSEGNIFVADMMSHCVQVFTPEGKFLTRIGKQGHTEGCLISPMSITIDKDDCIYVGDGMSCITTFNKNGIFMRRFGGSGMELGKFGLIRDIFLDINKMKLYICEWQTNRLQVFQ